MCFGSTQAGRSGRDTAPIHTHLHPHSDPRQASHCMRPNFMSGRNRVLTFLLFSYSYSCSSSRLPVGAADLSPTFSPPQSVTRRKKRIATSTAHCKLHNARTASSEVSAACAIWASDSSCHEGMIYIPHCTGFSFFCLSVGVRHSHWTTGSRVSREERGERRR